MFFLSLSDYRLQPSDVVDINNGISPQFANGTMPLILCVRGLYNPLTHCFAIFRNEIIDSTWDVSYPLTPENLAYAVGDRDCVQDVIKAVLLKPYKKTIGMYYEKTRSKGDSFEFVMTDYERAISTNVRKRKFHCSANKKNGVKAQRIN